MVQGGLKATKLLFTPAGLSFSLLCTMRWCEISLHGSDGVSVPTCHFLDCFCVCQIYPEHRQSTDRNIVVESRMGARATRSPAGKMHLWVSRQALWVTDPKLCVSAQGSVKKTQLLLLWWLVIGEEMLKGWCPKDMLSVLFDLLIVVNFYLLWAFGLNWFTAAHLIHTPPSPRLKNI